MILISTKFRLFSAFGIEDIHQSWSLQKEKKILWKEEL